MSKNLPLFWKIEIQKGIDTIFTQTVSTGKLTDSKIEQLLECLFMKYVLSDDEIVNSFLRKNSTDYFDYKKVMSLSRENYYGNDKKLRINYMTSNSGYSFFITLIENPDKTKK